MLSTVEAIESTVICEVAAFTQQDVAATLCGTARTTTPKQGGPLGRVLRIFDVVSALSRKKHKRILDIVEDLLMVHKGDL